MKVLIGIILATFLTLASAADEIHYTVTSQTSVTFNWRGSGNTIRYGSTASYGFTATAVSPSPMPFSSPGPFWEARLTGLTEATLYHYSIDLGPDHTFKTPPPLGSSGFTVMAIGDVGDSTSYSNMPKVQALITPIRPDLALLVGDLTYGNAHGQTHVTQHFNDVMVWSQDSPYMPAWGNHEWDDPADDDLRNYKGRFDLPNPQTSPGSPAVSCCSEDWYYFDYGNVRFIAYPEPFSGAWSDWRTKAGPIMDQAQANPLIKFIVTFGHRPAWSSGHHPGSTTMQGYMRTLALAHSKYVLNLNGHSHNYERTHPQSGVVHITSGGGGANLEQDGSCLWLGGCPAPSYTAYRAMRLGVLRLRFTDTAIEGTFICGPAGSGVNDVSCSSGSIIDTFTIGTPPPPPDTQPPVVSVTAVVSGTITMTAYASDNVGVVGVQFKLDGAPLGSEDLTAPYSTAWDTTTTPNGAHVITATAHDAAGNTATGTVASFTVQN